MLIYIRYFLVGIWQNASKQKLQRTLETASISSGQLQSEHYGAALKTPMVNIYALALDILKGNCNTENKNFHALELCSGPGVFSALAIKFLNIKKLLGVDLSDSMLEQARTNAKNNNVQEQSTFQKVDITQISKELTNQKFDLVMFMNGAHHLNTESEVKNVIQQADDVCSENGIVFILDPIRPKTNSLLNYYSQTVFNMYLNLKLTEFFRDFFESLHASYTIEEFKKCIPESSKRNWIHIVPLTVPSAQIIIGLPKNQTYRQIGNLTKAEINDLIPSNYRATYKMMKLDFKVLGY